jgi:hypothetical protein
MNFTKFEPILAALVLADVPIIAGLVNELASQHPSTVTTLIVAVGLVVLNAAGAWARSKVTPVAKLGAGLKRERAHPDVHTSVGPNPGHKTPRSF